MSKVRYDDVSNALRRFVPAASLPMVVNLMIAYPIHLLVKVPRRSVLGDYLSPLAGQVHRITVNGNLNPYLFLFIFLHEYAHLLVHLDRQKGQRISSSHGFEWQTHFKELARPFLNERIYPEPLLSVLQKHMHRPSATLHADIELVKEFKRYDNQTMDRDHVYVDTLSKGDRFEYEGANFELIGKQRVLYVCQRVSDGALYKFRPNASVFKRP